MSCLRGSPRHALINSLELSVYTIPSFGDGGMRPCRYGVVSDTSLLLRRRNLCIQCAFIINIDSISNCQTLWSAVRSSPKRWEVRFHRLVSEVVLSASGVRGLGHPTYFTMRNLWAIREHVVISSWFGILDSPCACKAFLLRLCKGVVSRIGFNRGRFSNQCCIVVCHFP